MRKIIKSLLVGLFYLLVLPSGVASLALHKWLGSSMLFDFFAQWYSLFPGRIGTLTRACFYEQTLAEAHLDLDIGFGSLVSKIDTTIGRGVLITGHTVIGRAHIGDRAVIANYVSVLSGRYQHNFQDISKDVLADEDRFDFVNIGHDAFVGEHCTVMANVGHHSIIGAGSVVVKDIPEMVVAIGAPAKPVKSRKPEAAS